MQLPAIKEHAMDINKIHTQKAPYNLWDYNNCAVKTAITFIALFIP